MNQHKVAVITAFYPGGEPFLADFLSGLRQQDFTDFDVVAVDDGCRNLSPALKEPRRFSVSLLDGQGSPLLNRLYAARWARDAGYQFLVFCDSDDVMAGHRLAKVLPHLEQYDIVVNELVIWDGVNVLAPSFIAHRLGKKFEIRPTDLQAYNFLGFSNTAIRSSSLDFFKLPLISDAVAGDWLFYSALLLEGARAYFTDTTYTYYRRHDANTAPLHGEDKSSYIHKIRTQHFSVIAKYYPKWQHLTQQGGCEQVRTPNKACAEALVSSAASTWTPLWWEIDQG